MLRGLLLSVLCGTCGGVISIQSATTILEEAINELNCAVDSMCTVLDILARASIVVCGWQPESPYVVGLR